MSNNQETPGQTGLFDYLFEPEPDPIWGDRFIRRERERVNQKPYGRQGRPTTSEPVVIDWRQSKEAMREAIERVDANASPTWKEVFYNALIRVACDEETFSCDEVWQRLSELPAIPHTSDNRAAAAVVLRAAKDGVIELVPGAVRRSNRKHLHRGFVQVYRSLVYGKQPTEVPAYS